ncbi:hypothetical protein DV736_g5116, partial [Chaetothyriales sp. CBS 134916]
MTLNDNPTDAPPSYAESQATGKSTASRRSQASPSPRRGTPTPSSIPAARRRSMEDELRPLPEGWIRLFDPKENHQFFVDTKANPPRSIWHHPYDDEEYLSSITSEERERIQDEEAKLRKPITPTSSDEKLPYAPPPSSPLASSPDRRSQELPNRAGRAASASATTSTGKKKTLSERLKEKATGMTKEERLAERQKRAEQERQYYEAHIKFRNALAEASRTGQPVFFMKDRDGHDVFVEPPTYPGYGGPYSGGYGGPYGAPYGPRAGLFGPGGYAINPYANGVYANPNARFIRPQQPYGRPYGGVGLGYGLPIAGGLLAGGLLGAALF